MNVNDAQIKEILENFKRITVLGLSPDASKPSQKVPIYMRANGYQIVGVNPGHQEIAGMKIFNNLSEVPLEYREFIDVFRKPDQIPMVIDEILKVGGTKVIWLQLGISHPEAEKKAERAGIQVISDRCLHLEYERLMRK